MFDDAFTGATLDGNRWIDHYLPHWTTPERSTARFEVDNGLRLDIDPDQPAWLPEDGPMRVSSLQTGVFSGPVGSHRGQHRHRPDLRVVTQSGTHRLWTPRSGLVEVTVRACADPTCLTAVWLVGLEEESEDQSGEICIAELFGTVVGPDGSRLRLGIKAHHDPRLATEMVDIPLELDATDTHSYAARWDAHGVDFYVDETLVHSTEQGLDYPLALMIDLFEFPTGDDRGGPEYPKSAEFLSVRGYRIT